MTNPNAAERATIDRLYDSACAYTRTSLGNAVNDVVWSFVYNSVHHSVFSFTWEATFNSVYNSVSSAVFNPIFAHLKTK